MEVFLADEQDLPVDKRRLAVLAEHTLRSEGMGEGTELSILFVGAEHIRRLNRRFAGDDYATDVLSFPLLEEQDEPDGEDLVLGDIVICPAVANGNAGRLGHSLQRELDTLLVHGTLHLLGYDHAKRNDRHRMEGRQKEILTGFHYDGGG